MNTTKKMTKREKFTALLTLLENYESDTPIVEGLTVEGATEFINHEIELLDKKNAVKGEKKPTAKQAENATIGQNVLDYLFGIEGGLTVSQIIKAVPGLPEDMSLPRMTHIVTALVNDGKVERYVEKRVAYFKAI